MKKKVLTISIYFLLCVLCIQSQSKIKSTRTEQSDIIFKTMQETLRKQLFNGSNRYSIEAGLEYPHSDFSKEDFNAAVYFSKNILSSNVYKNPTNEVFYRKIKEVFGRTLDSVSNKTSLYVNFLEKCNKAYCSQIQDGIDIYGTYIIKRNNFIMDFHYIPELVDYINEYPNIASLEDNFSIQRGDTSVYLWKELINRTDEYNLAKNRKYYLDKLIHRNKYLFNDSKSSLTWLLQKDKIFMQSLVTTFGYVKDEKLLKWVIDNNLFSYKPSNKTSNIDTFISIFSNKHCDGSWVFNQEALDVVDKNYDVKYYNSFDDFLIRFAEIDKTELTFEQKAEFAARILYWCETIYKEGKLQFPESAMTLFHKRNQNRDKYDDEFTRQNYYNLPNFSDYWSDALNYYYLSE